MLDGSGLKQGPKPLIRSKDLAHPHDQDQLTFLSVSKHRCLLLVSFCLWAFRHVEVESQVCLLINVAPWQNYLIPKIRFSPIYENWVK